MPPEELEQLLAQLYGYGVTPESLASLPYIPKSYNDMKWNQDAGTYVPMEMPIKPTSRTWLGNEMLRQLGVTLPMLGQAHGLPTIDTKQGLTPELLNGGQAAADLGGATVGSDMVEQATVPYTPHLDSLLGSQYAPFGEDIANGASLVDVKIEARKSFEDPNDPALKDLISEIEAAWEERNQQQDGGAGGSTAGKGEGPGDYRGYGELTPVQQMYAKAGVPMPWETYTGENLPDQYLPNMAKINKKFEDKGQKYLKSIKRFVEQTKKRQDDALTKEEREATSEAVRQALKGIGILGNEPKQFAEQSLDKAGYETGDYDGSEFNASAYIPNQMSGAWMGSPQNLMDTWGFSMQPPSGADTYTPNEQGGWSQLGTTPWAGGTPESHYQIAEAQQQYAQQNHDTQVRDAAAKIATAQGNTPSSDNIKAREALARFLGLI